MTEYRNADLLNGWLTDWNSIRPTEATDCRSDRSTPQNIAAAAQRRPAEGRFRNIPAAQRAPHQQEPYEERAVCAEREPAARRWPREQPRPFPLIRLKLAKCFVDRTEMEYRLRGLYWQATIYISYLIINTGVYLEFYMKFLWIYHFVWGLGWQVWW